MSRNEKNCAILGERVAAGLTLMGAGSDIEVCAYVELWVTIVAYCSWCFDGSKAGNLIALIHPLGTKRQHRIFIIPVVGAGKLNVGDDIVLNYWMVWDQMETLATQ